MTSSEPDDISDLEAQRDRLLGEVARLTVSKRTGVPVFLMAEGTDEASCQALADQALAWRADNPTPQPSQQPSTGAAPYGSSYGIPGQISREVFASLDPAAQMAAVRAGRCVQIGIGIPLQDSGTTRNGRHV